MNSVQAQLQEERRFIDAVLDTVDTLVVVLDRNGRILGLEDGRRRYINEVTALSQAFALAIPHEEALDVKDEYFVWKSGGPQTTKRP